MYQERGMRGIVVLLVVLVGCSWRGAVHRDGMSLGSAVRQNALELDRGYRRTLISHFSILVPENEMKFDAISPARGRYDFRSADDLVRFAMRHGILVHGHTLIWHRQLPSWINQVPQDRSTIEKLLVDHVRHVVGHFKGKVKSWDVVNEALNSDGSPRNSIWQRALGFEYVERAFREAQKADPEAKLFYNDFGIAHSGPKLDSLLTILQDFKKRRVPIDGVGIQMHLSASTQPSAEEFALTLQKIAGLGLLVRVSEMDVRVKLPPTPQELQNQSRWYQDVFAACSKVSACSDLTLWGFSDRYSWVPETFPGYGLANIFDQNFGQKIPNLPPDTPAH